MAGFPAKKILETLRFLCGRTAFLLLAAAAVSAVFISYDVMRLKMLNRVVPASSEDIVLFALDPDGQKPPDWELYKLYFRTVAKVMPGFSAPNGMLGYCHFYTGDLNKAASYYRKAAKQNPGFFWFHYNLGVIYFRQAKYKEAVDAFNKALNCRPEDAIIFINLSKIFRDLNRFATDAGYDPQQGLMEGYYNAKQMILACQYNIQKFMIRQHKVRIF